MMLVTKVAQYEIKKPLGITWEEFGKQLRLAMVETRGVLNRVIQYEWTRFCFKEGYRKEQGQYPDRLKEQDYFDGKTFGKWMYEKLREEFPCLNTANLSQSMQFASKRFKSDYRDILRGAKSVPSFKKDQPIDLHGQNLQIVKDDRGFIARVSLLSKEGKEKLEFNNPGKIDFVIVPGDSSGKAILNRIASGLYKVGSSKIRLRNRKWFLLVNYQFEQVGAEVDPKKIMGIDLGIAVPLCVAFSDSDKKRVSFIEAKGEIEHFRRTIEARRRSLLRQGKTCGDGRIGHGRSTRIAPIDTISHKAENFRDTCNHKYSRRIIEIARKAGCGVIQMENLEGISQANKFLKNWTYFDLQQKIKYKAEEVGIEVRFVEPRYTSQRCSECGHIDRENRPDQATFKCTRCGYEENADFNAARNLATEGIEEIIDKTVSGWEDTQPKKSEDIRVF